MFICSLEECPVSHIDLHELWNKVPDLMCRQSNGQESYYICKDTVIHTPDLHIKTHFLQHYSIKNITFMSQLWHKFSSWQKAQIVKDTNTDIK